MPETHATTSTAAPVFPAGRYGRRREPRQTPRWAVFLAAVAMAVATGLVGVSLYQAYGEGDYSAAVTQFSTADDHVVITILVRLPEGAAGRCVLRARDIDGAETGREEIIVRPGPDPARTIASHRLVTRARPVTGEVVGCRPA